MAYTLSASILSADFSNIQRVCELVNASDADAFHLDVMDGAFVPNLSFGFPVMKAIFKYASKPLDVHLMIVDPDTYLERFRDAGADTLTIHFETCKHLHQSIDNIHKLGLKACIAINPLTPVQCLSDLLMNIDSVCLMSVNPGFGGQVFLQNTWGRIKELKELIAVKKSVAWIKVDGGISLKNYRHVLDAGANSLVAGSAVFGAEDPLSVIRALKGFS